MPITHLISGLPNQNMTQDAFDSAVAKLMDDLPPWAAEVNALAADVNAKAIAAAGSEGVAATKANEARDSAATAALDAALAQQAAIDAAVSAVAAAGTQVLATSSTSLVPGLGAKVLQIQPGKQFGRNVPIFAVSASDASRYIYGTVGDYTGPALTINATAAKGSVAVSDWIVSVSGIQGIEGNLSGGTLTGPLYCAGQDIVSAVFKGGGQAFFNAGSSNTLDRRNGAGQRWAPNTGTQTLNIIGWPPGGIVGDLWIKGVNLGAATIVWPGINWQKPDGNYTTTFADLGIALKANGVDQMILWTDDGGTTIYGKVIR